MKLLALTLAWVPLTHEAPQDPFPDGDEHLRAVARALGLVAATAPEGEGVVLPGELELTAPGVRDASGRAYRLAIPAPLAEAWRAPDDDATRAWAASIAKAPIDWHRTVVAEPRTVRFGPPDESGLSRATFTLSRSEHAAADTPSFDVRVGIPCSCRLLTPEVVRVADEPVEVILEWDRTQLLDVRGLPITLDVAGGQPVAVMVERDDDHPFSRERSHVEIAPEGEGVVRIRLAADPAGSSTYGLFQEQVEPDAQVRITEVAEREFDVAIQLANDYDYAPIDLTARVGAADHTLIVKPTEPWPLRSATGAVRLFGSAVPGERVLVMRSRVDGEARLAFPDRLAGVERTPAAFDVAAELVAPAGSFGFWSRRVDGFEIHLREDESLVHTLRSWLTNW